MLATWVHPTKPQLTWIDERPESPTVKRGNQSTLRAHAARIAHQRRRVRQVAEYASESPSPISTASFASIHAPNAAYMRPVLPKPATWCGNSDPFDSQALQINPRVAQTIDFLRHAWIPRTHAISAAKSFSSRSKQLFEQQKLDDYMTSLSNESFGKAFLLPFMIMLQQLVQHKDLELKVAELRLEIVQTLKKSFGANSAGDTTTMYLMQSLLLASIAERQLWEVQIHTNAMQTALTSRYDSQRGLAAECGTCTSLGTERSHLNNTSDKSLLEVFAPQFLSVFTLPCSDKLSNSPGKSRAYEDGPMRKFGIDIRHCLWMWHMASTTSPELLSNRQFASMIWTGIYEYLKEVEALINLDNFTVHASLESRAHWYTQACMAIGLLCHLQTNAIAELSQLQNPAWLIPRLQMYLNKAVQLISCLNAVSTLDHRAVFLFSLWSAAVLERCTVAAIETIDHLKPETAVWSQQKLITTAKNRGFRDWETMHTTLTDFAPYITFPHSGQEWITEALTAPDHRDQIAIGKKAEQQGDQAVVTILTGSWAI